MSIVTGSSPDYKTMLADFISFLTTNAELVSAEQNWSVLRTDVVSTHNDHLLRGPGLAGTDQIHVRLRSDSSGSNYGWTCQGFVSYNSALTNSNQPGISPTCGMALRNDTIPYWFLANGRRFMVIAKVSTYYMSLYAGFFLPWATPAEYPYPMYVGGSHQSAISHNYTTTSSVVGSFWKPAASCAYLRDTAGAWLQVTDTHSEDCAVYPYAFNLALTQNAEGAMAVWPCVLFKRSTPKNIFGVLDGVEAMQYINNGAENTFTLTGKPYTVFPTVHLATKWAYAALLME